jgi:hypothetical protein
MRERPGITSSPRAPLGLRHRGYHRAAIQEGTMPVPSRLRTSRPTPMPPGNGVRVARRGSARSHPHRMRSAPTDSSSTQDSVARWHVPSVGRTQRSSCGHHRPARQLSYHGVLAPHARRRSHVVPFGAGRLPRRRTGAKPAPRAAGAPRAGDLAALMRKLPHPVDSSKVDFPGP